MMSSELRLYIADDDDQTPPREYAEHRYWRDYTKRNIRLHSEEIRQ